MALRRAGSGLCLLAGLALIGCARFFWAKANAPSPGSVARLNRELPSLPVDDESGKAADLAQVARGSKRVIVFYSLSCPVCRTVLPELVPFPSSLRLVLVHVGSGSQGGQFEVAGIPWSQHFRDTKRVLFRSFPMSSIPTVLFVDERGILLEAWVGARCRGHLARRLIAFAEGRL